MKAFNDVICQNSFLFTSFIFGQDQIVESSNDILDLTSFPSFEQEMREIKQAALINKRKWSKKRKVFTKQSFFEDKPAYSFFKGIRENSREIRMFLKIFPRSLIASGLLIWK